MIPRDELQRLQDTVREAAHLARSGRVAQGYECLDVGLLWAETPPFDTLTGEHEEPEPWAEALIHRYRLALVRYADKFGVAFRLMDLVPLEE